jgi:hypothetical protein
MRVACGYEETYKYYGALMELSNDKSSYTRLPQNKFLSVLFTLPPDCLSTTINTTSLHVKLYPRLVSLHVVFPQSQSDIFTSTSNFSSSCLDGESGFCFSRNLWKQAVLNCTWDFNKIDRLWIVYNYLRVEYATSFHIISVGWAVVLSIFNKTKGLVAYT